MFGRPAVWLKGFLQGQTKIEEYYKMQGEQGGTEISMSQVYEKVGRNILHFQELEHLMKFIVSHGNISAPIKSFRQKQAENIAIISKQTLGQVTGQFVQNTFKPQVDELESDESDDGHFSISFKIRTDSAYREWKKQELQRLVSERNELVHHLIPNVDFFSMQARYELATKLDAQLDIIQREIKELRKFVTAIIDSRTEMLEFLQTDEGKRQLESSSINCSELAFLLFRIAAEIQREDGWTALSDAGQILKVHEPEELARLKSYYGHKSLKSFVLECDMLDLYEEPTKNGGVQILYRMNKNWRLADSLEELPRDCLIISSS